LSVSFFLQLKRYLFNKDGKFFSLVATFCHFSHLRPTRRNIFYEQEALCCIHCFKMHGLYHAFTVQLTAKPFSSSANGFLTHVPQVGT